MPHFISLTSLAVAAAFTTAAALPQRTDTPPSRNDAAISGVVIDGATKQPIADAVVELRSPSLGRSGVLQYTDARGRYVFTDVPGESDYTVQVTQPGYFPGAYGALSTGRLFRRTIHVRNGEWFSTADVLLWRPSSISGSVLDEHGDPVIGVIVRLLARVRVGASEHLALGTPVLTDDRGMYRIPMLESGRYMVMVPSVQASVLAPRSALTAVRPGDSVDTFVTTGAKSKVVVGNYAVPPPPVGGQSFAYPIAFYGGSSIGQAATVSVAPGVDVAGINIQIVPAAASTVRGRVKPLPPVGTSVLLRLVAEGLEELGFGAEAGTASVDSDGVFVFGSVPAGRYVIATSPSVNQYLIGDVGIFYTPQVPRPPGVSGISTIGGGVFGAPGTTGFSAARVGTSALFARTPVTVAIQDEDDVVVSLQPTSTVRGRIVIDFDPSSPEPSSPGRFIGLESATGSPSLGRPRATTSRVAADQMLIEGIVPGAYYFRIDTAGWQIKSALVNGREYARTPFEIGASTEVSDVVVTLTNASGSVSGAVRELSGAQAVDSAVIAFPRDRLLWTNYGFNPVNIRTTMTSAAGSYQIGGLPAGDYFLIAVRAERVNDLLEPGFFERAQSHASAVTLGWGSKATIDLRVADVR